MVHISKDVQGACINITPALAPGNQEASLSDMCRAFWQVLHVLIALWRRTTGEGEARAPIITGELIIIQCIFMHDS